MTWSQVAAFRLSRHHLAARAPARALVRVVGAMGGAQAQLLSAAQVSLWARVDHLRRKDVEDAVERRALVKAWCMRRTLHLVPADDLAVFIRGSARRAEREIQWVRGKGIGDRALDKLIDAALSALQRPLTGPELIDEVSRSLRVPVRRIRGGGWGSVAEIPGVALGRLAIPVRYLLHLVAARGVVCSGPDRGREPTFVRADTWIPKWRDLARDDAEAELLRRYLQAYGPATPADFARWTGMSLSNARDVWARQQSDMAVVSVDGWTAAVLRRDLRTLRPARAEPLPVRLLPYFDSYLLGHEARQHLVALRHHKKVYREQGWIAPVVLLDGRVAGIWGYTRERDCLRLRVTSFDTISKRTAAGIRAEAGNLGRFIGCSDVDVRID